MGILRDRGRRPLLVLGVCVFFLHLLVTGGHLMSPDEELLYRVTESIAFRGTTSVVPLEADLSTGELHPSIPPEFTFATRVGKTPGTFYAQYLPLQPLLAVPFVYTAKALEGVFAEPFARVMWPSMTVSYLDTLSPEVRARALFRRGFVVMLFNPLIAALTAIALARTTMLVTGNRRAGIATAAFWAVGTMAWPHSRTFFTEPLAALFAFLAFDAFLRWHMTRDSGVLRYAGLCGLWLALANWTRVDAPFFTVGIVAAMAGYGVWSHIRLESYHRIERPARSLHFILTGAIALAAWGMLQAFNAMRFGVDITSGYGDQSEAVKFSTPLLIGLHGLFMSPGKGLFFFSPALILGVWGWCRVPAGWRFLRNSALIVYTPFLLAMAMWQNWDGGWCWGPRHIVQINLPIILGAVFLFQGTMTSVRRVAISTIMLVGAFVQLYGSSQNPLSFYQEYFLTFRDNVYYRSNVRDLQAARVQEGFAFTSLDNGGRPIQALPAGAFPAPMVDSLYVPQHTQWYGYADMWRLGYCDWYFFNLLTGRENPDPMEMAQ